MTKLRACLIGCGDIGYGFDKGRKGGGALSHFRALTDSTGYELCGISDISREALAAIEDTHGAVKYTDAVDMLTELRPEVVTIASSDETHIPLLKTAAEFRPKAVFCEKPLGTDASDVKEIVREYSGQGILLQVNYTRRFLEQFGMIRELIQGGSLGKIDSVTFYYGRGLVHNASHYIDLVLMMFGMPQEVTVLSSRDGFGEDDRSYSFRLGYDSGTEIIFLSLEPSKLSFAEIDIIGSEGRIRFNYMNELEFYKVTENTRFRGYKMYELFNKEPVKFETALPNAYKNLWNAAVKGEELKCSAGESVKLFEVINRIKEK